MSTTHTIYTLGYIGWRPDDLRETVQRLGACLIDIRYRPRSRAPQWNGAALARLVGTEHYQWVQSFGNLHYKTPGEIVLVDPQAGLAIVAPMLQERPVILLCACQDRQTCHRTPVADLLAGHTGLPVEHLERPGHQAG